MVAFRVLLLLLLGSAGLLFGAYALTGRIRYKQLGLKILRWTLVGAFGFFAVLAVQRFF
ncbi:hypothetical protein JI739_17790 [Ramlibacter sp. AW1]|uniref:Uncharacterized protein n=1 Tax=Ramlibacter aurantiacus TaxID=2801330 RepID=A0A936ZW44_9BURK|nr:hypothetical protein [Ramlibacter aurantiacus]MBL0422205.1 hypothetical protein [Ramlibacter aurantiacus]